MKADFIQTASVVKTVKLIPFLPAETSQSKPKLGREIDRREERQRKTDSSSKFAL